MGKARKTVGAVWYCQPSTSRTTFNIVFYPENKPDFLLSVLTGIGGIFVSKKVPEVQNEVGPQL